MATRRQAFSACSSFESRHQRLHLELPGTGTVSQEFDTEKIAQAAAQIVAMQGDKAIDHARQLEAQSVVPELARRVREEVERLVAASTQSSAA